MAKKRDKRDKRDKAQSREVKTEDDVKAELPEINSEVAGQRIRHDVKCTVKHDKKVNFTMDLARQFIEMPEFQGERKLRDGHVEFLCQHAKNGTFLTDLASLIDCECEYDGKVRRLNGHHTAWMRHFMPSSWTPKIQWLRYSVKTEDDFRKLYSLIDRGASRTPGHVAQARLFGTLQYAGISKRTISASKNGLAYWKWGHNKGRRRVDEIVNMMEQDYYKVTHDVATFINDIAVAESFMRRACVTAAVFASFAKAKGPAVEFWTAVRTGLGIEDAHDPRKTLRDYLLRTRVMGSNSFNRTNMVAAEAMYRGCIHAWNAWRRKESLQQITVRMTTDKRPALK